MHQNHKLIFSIDLNMPNIVLQLFSRILELSLLNLPVIFRVLSSCMLRNAGTFTKLIQNSWTQSKVNLVLPPICNAQLHELHKKEVQGRHTFFGYQNLRINKIFIFPAIVSFVPLLLQLLKQILWCNSSLTTTDPALRMMKELFFPHI